MSFTQSNLDNHYRSVMLLLPILMLSKFLHVIFINEGFMGAALLFICFTFVLFFIHLNARAADIILFILATNFLLGPFGFLGNYCREYLVLQRVDYFAGFVLLLCYISDRKILRYIALPIFVFGLGNTFLWFTGKHGFLELLSDFILIGSLISLAVFLLTETIKDTLIRRCIKVLFLVHIAVSAIQLIVPISLRGTELTTLYGYYRPTGLLEWSYTYGVTTVLLFWIAYRPNLLHVKPYLSLLTMLLSIISTRTVLLGGILTLVISRLKFVGAILIIAFAILIILMPGLLDQSNQTKVLLAYLVVSDFVISPWTDIIFGHGLGSAAELVNSNQFAVLQYSSNLLYDNRIDNGDGFPIHNVFLEILFDRGAVVFGVFLLIFSFTAIKLIRASNLTSLFIFSVIVTNYLLHNGFYTAPFFILSISSAAWLKNA